MTNLCDLAALDALGALEGHDAARFAAHLAAGCPACTAERGSLRPVTDDLALAAPPVAPPSELRARVLAEVDREAAERFRFLLAGDGVWGEIGPDVARRDLGAGAYLIRMGRGARVIAHVHEANEHCYVLEGDLHVAGRHLRAGDYHRAAAGSMHEAPWSDGGCLLLVVES